MELIEGRSLSLSRGGSSANSIEGSVIKNTQLKHQEKVLKKLINKGEGTDFGIINKFHEINYSKTLIQDFKSRVPIVNYEQFYANWLKRAIDGYTDHIWPGKVKYFALSSGSSGHPSKMIPISKACIRQFKKTSLSQIIDLKQYDLSPSFYRSKFLILGGSTYLYKFGKNQFQGDISGILAKNKAFFSSTFSKPGKKISKLTDWNEKINQIVDHADKWDIGVISGVPSWVCLLLERIVKKYKLNSIHEIWPNLTFYIHGGLFIETYMEQLSSYFSKPIVFKNTFLASEGFFAIHRSKDEEHMELLTRHGIFYEFVEEKYFDKLRNEKFYDIPTKTIDEIEPHVNYAMVVSTNSGLWRYNIGDVIQFTDQRLKHIKIIGRLSFFLNSCGENLSEENMVQAIYKTSKILNIIVPEYCVHIPDKNDHHKWFFGTNRQVCPIKFASILDEQLCLLNDDYKNTRRYLLKEPVTILVPQEKFYEYMESINKLGGQNKTPRVLTGDQAKKWERFLSKT